ncbi:DJ-1/PfpI family protein [Catenuloplanes atrovinosus]|uniref:Transcriptional regulator GlxA family with amidase domain n=1 Tax=Catenuloplanes atrovinosus TaxID=137266 RepID=A0AAE3YN40_9ACTN|nr:DJ-1/PfpI family protein [Catenuloplanes atrovinosus]MDR7275552.1 transcriptional regulator GlxA family with amidase domain [Catenuloplanes atrovinosus]
MNRRSLLGAAAATHRRPAWSPESPLRVQVVVFDGVEEMDYTGPFEIFSIAARMSSGAATVTLAGGGEPGEITGYYGSRFTVTARLDPAAADLIVVPGGGYGNKTGPGIWGEIAKGVIPAALRAAPRPGLTISSLCTGAFLLAEAGLLTGRRCTTHHLTTAEIAERGGVITNARVVDDGDVVTASAVTSGIDLALHLVRRELGADVAVRIENLIGFERRGTVWRA